MFFGGFEGKTLTTLFLFKWAAGNISCTIYFIIISQMWWIFALFHSTSDSKCAMVGVCTVPQNHKAFVYVHNLFFFLDFHFVFFLCVVMNLRAIGFNQAVGWFWPCPAFLRITPSSLQFRPRRGRAVYVVTSSQYCGIISYCYMWSYVLISSYVWIIIVTDIKQFEIEMKTFAFLDHVRLLIDTRRRCWPSETLICSGARVGKGAVSWFRFQSNPQFRFGDLPSALACHPTHSAIIRF